MARAGYGAGDGLACGLLTAAWLGAVLCVGTGGEFPLNDDWAYAHATRSFLETGRIERLPWTWTPIVTHVGIGAAFSSLLGFSFETLRIAGLSLGCLGLLAAYGLCRQAGAGVWPSALGAAVVGFNPIHLNLSFTFMTDVPFAALTTASLLLLARGLERLGRTAIGGGGIAAIGGGLALAAAATFSRQPGAAVPVAFFAALLVGGRIRARWLALGAVVLVGGVLLLDLWAEEASGLFTVRGFVEDTLHRPGLVRLFATQTLEALVYLGLFLSPVVALCVTPARWLAAAAAAAFATAAVLLLPARMPLGGNVLYDLGVGPATLQGSESLGGGPAWLWFWATALAFASTGFACSLCAQGVRRRWSGLRDRPGWLLLAAFPLVYLPPLLTGSEYFDRSLLPVLAPLVALLLVLPAPAQPPPRAAAAAALVLLLLLGGFGVAGTRDYLEHHRARQVLFEEVMALGIPPDRIDAGFELDGWHNRDVLHWRRDAQGVHDPEYLLVHGAPRQLPARYRLVRELGYRRLLPPRVEVIGLYQRTRPFDAPPPPRAGASAPTGGGAPR
jgi:hypothetical protein